MGLLNAQLIAGDTDIIQADLGTSGGVPIDKTFAIVNISICNTYDPDGVDASTRSAKFDVHMLPAAKTMTTDRQATTVIRRETLQPGETFILSEKFVLEEGDAVVLSASPDVESGLTDLSATVSYLEI